MRHRKFHEVCLVVNASVVRRASLRTVTLGSSTSVKGPILARLAVCTYSALEGPAEFALGETTPRERFAVDEYSRRKEQFALLGHSLSFARFQRDGFNYEGNLRGETIQYFLSVIAKFAVGLGQECDPSHRCPTEAISDFIW